MGCALFITLSVFAYFIEKLDGVVLQVGILMIVLFAEIAWVQVEYNADEKEDDKKEEIDNRNSEESSF